MLFALVFMATSAVISLGCGGKGGVSIPSGITNIVPVIALAAPTNPTKSSETIKNFADKKAALETILTSQSVQDCFKGITYEPFVPSDDCFGPVLVFSTHPTETNPVWSNASPPSDCPANSTCLNAGDLGLWVATNTSTSESCAARKLNTLIEDMATISDTGLKLGAALACGAAVTGVAVPEQGAKATDILDAIKSGASSAGVTLTKASLSREGTNFGSNPIYRSELEGTIGDYAFSYTIRHSPSQLTGDFQGRVYGYIDTSSGQEGTADSRLGFSVTYQQLATQFLLEMKSGVSPSDASGLFDDDGNYKFDAFKAGTLGTGYSKAKYFLANVDSTAGLGTVKATWQDNPADKKARVLHVKVQTGSNSDEGIAYFGFGPKFGSATGTLTDIGGMCCNWAGPGKQCNSDETTFDSAGKVQSQEFRRATAGHFAPTSSSSKNNITFAPTNTCDYTTGTNFRFGLIASWTTDGAADHATVTNDLVAYAAGVGVDGWTIATLLAPSFTTIEE